MLSQISDAKSSAKLSIFNLYCRSCIIGPELSVKVCSIGTVINRSAYASDYCQLEGTTGRQTQPMPIRWMAWESVLLVSSIPPPSTVFQSNKCTLFRFFSFSFLLCSFTA